MIGIVCSGGGSAVAAAHDFARSIGRRLHVITDRACGFEEFCSANAIRHERIEEGRNEAFSERAAESFERSGAMAVLLFYDRLVGPALTARWPCVNFHPSLLPAYPGFKALERAVADRVPYLGATCHLADETVDGGPILAQSVYPMRPGDFTVARAFDISFVQKLALTLLFLVRIVERRSPAEFLAGWREQPAPEPGGFLNPNALPEAARTIVLAQAGRRNMTIAI